MDASHSSIYAPASHHCCRCVRERQQPRHLRNTDLKIAFLSQQQLRSFNLPYQLGFSGDVPGFKGNFETPNDADTSSIALLPGDVVVLATDGLFDNLGNSTHVHIHMSYITHKAIILARPARDSG